MYNIISTERVGTGNAEKDLEPINDKFIGEEYGWDRMGEVKWDMLIHNFTCLENIINNPKQFPQADFERVEKNATALQEFLMRHGYIVR